jgi:hypothetical protein
MGFRVRRSAPTGSRTSRQLVLSFVFLLVWGLIVQSAAMMGFGVVGIGAAWILMRRSALREMSTTTEEE